MFRKPLSLTSARVLTVLLCCASLEACWWDGHGSTASASDTVGGTISGLTTSGLVLANGSDRLNISAGATSFSFPTAVTSGSPYAITVAVQPTGASCVIANGSGTASNAAISAQVTCTAAQYHLGGTLTGLSASGLTLTNGSDAVRPAANATTFTFPTTVGSGATYSVSVSAQPAGLNCTVSAGSGTVGSADVTSVAVTCSAVGYHLGGTITGLTATGLVLANGTDTVSPAANATSFTLPTTVTSGSTYSVIVQTQPTGLSCTVSGGSGTVGTSDVSTIAVTCSSSSSTGFTALAGQTSCPAGAPDQNGTGSAASLPFPTSLVGDAAGNVYTASWNAFVINKITSAGVVTTLAGQYKTPGFQDGTGTAAQLAPSVILGGVDSAGNLYLSETSNIRRVTPTGVVSTLAGPTTGDVGYVDDTGSAARFGQWGLGVTPDGTSYVSDYSNHVVRKVSPAGVATTLAGSGQSGDVDGVGSAAQFVAPKYAAVDANGTTYVSDQNGMQVRKVAADGTVTTLAGGTSNGWTDGQGTNARFYGIQGLAIGPNGSVYVLDQPAAVNGSVPYSQWQAIRQISADGTVTTVVVSSAVENAYYGVPPGNHIVISQPLQAIGSAPNGTLLAGTQCAVGTIALP